MREDGGGLFVQSFIVLLRHFFRMIEFRLFFYLCTLRSGSSLCLFYVCKNLFCGGVLFSLFLAPLLAEGADSLAQRVL